MTRRAHGHNPKWKLRALRFNQASERPPDVAVTDECKPQEDSVSIRAPGLSRTGGALKAARNETRAVRLVREYLSDNYAERVELAQLSKLTGLSPFHLTRVFTAAMGLPPHAFLKQVRIARATALLRDKLPISQVALETGFADQSHLTRAFEKIVGVAPGAYSRLAPRCSAQP